MAFDPSTATLAQDTKPSSTGGGFDPSTATPVESTTKPVEGKGGAAFGMYPKAGVNQDPVSRLATHVGRTSAEAIVPTGAGFAGFGAGLTMAAPVAATVAPLTGPFAPFVAGAIELGGGLGVAMASSGAAKWMQDLMHETFAPEDYAQRQEEKKQYPTATFLTELGVGLVGTSPKTAVTAVKEGAGKIARLASTPAGQRVVSGGLQGSLEAGTELASEGKIEPWKVATATAAGAAMPGMNIAGKVPFAVGEKIGTKISDKLRGIKTPTPTLDVLPPKPPEGATPEEKAAYIQKLEAIKAERDAKAPLVEAAIRNKETGAIERMGPKHDEQRKAETKDTHEEGFIDERGNFHERQAAVDQAKRAGQIPQDHVLENPPGEREGLHSGDLRKVGDKRFEITTEEPVSKTRESYKNDITKNENDRINLTIEEQKARLANDTENAERLKKEIDRLETEHTQLLKDMPEVQFKNKAAPTHEEWHDHVWGSKTLGEAIDKTLAIKGLGGVGQRILAKALRKSEFISNAKLELTKDILKYTDKNGKEKNALGLYYGGSEHRVQLGKGSSITELLHEAMHAGTQKLLLDKTSFAAIEMHKLFDKYQQDHIVKYEEALERFKEDNPNATLEELNRFREENDPYGFENVDEFVAEAFTDKKFQELLSTLNVRERTGGVISNLWDSFKEVVRLNLGVPETARSVFDDVIEHGATLIEESKEFKRDTNGNIVISPSRLSKEVHDQLEREGIPIAHTSPYKFGMFDWVKHALSGEGAMAFGAGTYGSQKDSTNKYYVQMAKQKALDKYLESPEGKADKTKLKNIEYDVFEANEKVGDINSKIKRAVQYLEYFKSGANGPENDPFVQNAKRRIAEQEAKIKQLNDEWELLSNDARKKEIEYEFAREELAEKVKVPTYHSSIKATSDELLDWDSSQQSELVNNAFKTLGVEPQAEKLTWNKYDKDKYEATTSSGQNLYVGKRDAGISDGWMVVDSFTGEVLKYTKTLEEALNNNKTGYELYRELSKKFEPQDAATRNSITDREAQQIGDAKASIALAEQGVVGNVHDAQGGTEKTFRNYVVFDDSRITQNFVVLASREKKTTPSSSGEPVEIDRTKTDPRDVKDEKEFYEIAADIYEKHGNVAAVKFYEGYKEYKKTWLEPIKETEKFVGTNIQNKQAAERIIYNETSKMMEQIKDPARREAIAEAVDKGDLSGLSPEELAVAKQYEALVKDIGNRAVEQGVVKGLLEDYVTHILDWAGAPKGLREEFIQSLLGTGKRDPAMGDMTTESKFGKERKFKTFADLEWYINDVNSRIAAAGKSDWRLQLKTKDIAEIYKEYASSMEKAIENKKLVDNLKQIRNANGETLIKEVNKENPLPYGWQMMDSPQFAGYAVHPDLVPHLKFVFDAGPGRLMAALGNISQWTKFFNVIGSFFHAKSLMEVMSSAQIPIWTPLKEAIVLPLVEKGVKVATGKELQLSAITKALDQFRKGGVGDNVDTWIKSELTLDMPEDVTKGVLTRFGKFGDLMISKYGPKTRVLESSLSTVEKYTLGLFNEYTWNYLHTGGKLMVANAYLDKARMQAAKEGKPFDEMASRKEIARFVNESFGGLNWYDIVRQTENEFAKRMALAAYSPAGRRSLQIMLFAPDWSISTIRAFTAALPKELNPTKWHPVEGIKGMMNPTTKADYARLYQFKTALTVVTLINAINMMTAGRPIWENKDPTRVEFPDGTSMQAMKHAMEPYHWIADPDKTLSNKLGFIPKAAIVGIGGLEYASPDAPKLVDRSATGRLKAALSGALPFQASAAMTAPEGEGAKRALLGTMGFPVYGSTAEQKKDARAERQLATKEQAWNYRDKEIKAGRLKWTSKHDSEKKSLERQRKAIDKKKAGEE